MLRDWEVSRYNHAMLSCTQQVQESTRWSPSTKHFSRATVREIAHSRRRERRTAANAQSAWAANCRETARAGTGTGKLYRSRFLGRRACTLNTRYSRYIGTDTSFTPPSQPLAGSNSIVILASIGSVLSHRDMVCSSTASFIRDRSSRRVFKWCVISININDMS